MSAQSAAKEKKSAVKKKKSKLKGYVLTTNTTSVFCYTYLDARLYLFSDDWTQWLSQYLLEIGVVQDETCNII